MDWGILIGLVRQYGIGFLFRLFIGFLARLRAARLDDESVLEWGYNMVASLERSYSERGQGAQKRTLFDANAWAYLTELGKEVSQSLVDSLRQTSLDEFERVKTVAGQHVATYMEAKLYGLALPKN